MSNFDRIKEADFRFLLGKCKEVFPTGDVERAVELLSEVKKNPEAMNEHRSLFLRWYESLKTSTPDYSVYGEWFYLVDLWMCWTQYSRNSVKVLGQTISLVDESLVSNLSHYEGSIVDLGCGFGLTTLCLSELFPDRKIYGTNLESSYQFKLGKELCSENKKITILPDCTRIKESIALCFASEYFEHWERPVEHLHDVLGFLNPSWMVTANAFNTESIGHFKIYKHFEKSFNGREISKLFNETLRDYGYEKMKTKIWNNRPAVWRLKG